MRLFIGIQLSEQMRKSLIAVMHDLKQQGVNGSYVPVDNMHLTLAFIGETKDAERVQAVMDGIRPGKFRLTLDGSGYFGDLMWVGVKSGQALKKYASDLKMALKEQGLPCDMKKLEPHITIVRKVKGPRPSSVKVPRQEMDVTKISLMRSDVVNGKRVYKEIYSVRT